jgi:RNA polymerase sigma-70 factor (ECF subfamily)
MTDSDILQRINEDDTKVITELYKQFLKEIVLYLTRKFPSFSKQDAEDIFAESFNILYVNIKEDRINKKPGSIKSYIKGICNNLAYDETIRRDRAEGRMKIEYSPMEEDPDWIALEKKTVLLSQTVSRLTEPCKTLLELFWFKEKSDKEILKLTNYKDTNTVKNQRSRCMIMLKKVFLSKLVAEEMITYSDKIRLIGE